MSDSDSEDSFHSAEDAEEDFRQRDRDVTAELASLRVAKEATTTKTSTSLKSTVPPLIQPAVEGPSWADTLESDLDLDEMLEAEQKAILEKKRDQIFRSAKPDLGTAPPPLTTVPLPLTTVPPPLTTVPLPLTTAPPPFTTFPPPLITARRNSGPSEPSSTASPSEPSTDKESGNDLKDWDRFSRKSIEESRQEKATPTTAVPDQSLLDEWETGWDETDVTEEDIAAVTKVLPTTSTPTESGSLMGKKLKGSPIDSPVKKPTEPSAAFSSGPTEPSAASSSGPREPSAGSSSGPTEPSAASSTGQTGMWGKWGGWGTNLLITAVGQVGQGLNVVMDTVEQSLGAPKPEELAAARKAVEEADVWDKEPSNVKREKETMKPSVQRPLTQPEAATTTTTGWLSDLSSKVQSGGLSLVSNSLDVLEGLGKKTMEVVNDKDPGLKQTKAVLTRKIN
ncbi:hypothetical protein BV898_02560 [Hypsibius exemplaris]|uniref:Uncharacterized protein n=1 Tax=Hypsibius exemplaris TaxID=2072580 RepID=A0A1W0X7Q1_HYPEX|nr:hypothetical protein BV898_02560 [Hypsibius exemplaris]